MKNEKTVSKVADDVKAVVETKAEEVKKAVETKKTEIKKAVEEKKEEKAEKAAAKPAEKAAAKPAKKTAKKAADPKTNVYIEFQDRQVLAKDILKAAEKAYKKSHRGETIKTIEIYVKPEENVAYYVVNGEGSADYFVAL